MSYSSNPTAGDIEAKIQAHKANLLKDREAAKRNYENEAIQLARAKAELSAKEKECKRMNATLTEIMAQTADDGKLDALKQQIKEYSWKVDFQHSELASKREKNIRMSERLKKEAEERAVALNKLATKVKKRRSKVQASQDQEEKKPFWLDSLDASGAVIYPPKKAYLRNAVQSEEHHIRSLDKREGEREGKREDVHNAVDGEQPHIFSLDKREDERQGKHEDLHNPVQGEKLDICSLGKLEYAKMLIVQKWNRGMTLLLERLEKKTESTAVQAAVLEHVINSYFDSDYRGILQRAFRGADEAMQE